MINSRMLLYICAFFSLIPLVVIQVYAFSDNLYAQIDALTYSLSLFALFLLFTNMPRVLFSVLIGSSLILTVVFLKASEEYLAFFQSYIHYDALQLFDEFLMALKKFDTMTTSMYLLSMFIGLALLHVLVIKKCPPPKLYEVCIACVVATVGLYLTTSVHAGRYTSVDLGEGFHQKKFDYHYENPMMFFIRSFPFINKFYMSDSELHKAEIVSVTSTMLKQHKLTELHGEYNPQKYDLFILDYPGFKRKEAPVNPLSFVPSSDGRYVSHGRKNVIIVVMESLRLYEVGSGKADSITPNLDNIAEQSVWFENVFSNGRHTVKSEQAILCSTLDTSLRNSYAVVGGDYNGECLPDIVKKYGYETVWFHGNTKEFYNREVFHPALGFDTIYSKEVFESKGYDSETDIGWGIPDPVVYEVALKHLKASKGPFFAEILTVSNHQPFDWDYGDFAFPVELDYSGDDIYKNYRKGIYYSDHALGLFWEAFKKSGLQDNTIVVIVGDHGVPFYPDNMTDVKEQFDALFRSPLLIYDSSLKHQVISQQLSHLDIAPTILSLLEIHEPVAFLGRAALGAQKSNAVRPIFHMNMEDYGFRFGDTECIPQYKSCQGGSKGCYEDDRFTCKLADSEDAKILAQSRSFMTYLQMMTQAGYTSGG